MVGFDEVAGPNVCKRNLKGLSMRYWISAIGVLLLLVSGGGCDRHSNRDGTVVLHLTVQMTVYEWGWRELVAIQTYVLRLRPKDEIVGGLKLRQILTDTTVRVGFDMHNVYYAHQDRLFEGVKDSAWIGLVDVSFIDSTIDAQTIWRIRVDTSDYANKLTECDSIPCRVETTETENPHSWSFPRKSYRSNGAVETEWTEILVGERFMQHGILRIYNSNSRPDLEFEFDSGWVVGLKRGWHSNGQQQFEGRKVKSDAGYVYDALRHGIWTYWDSTGRECGRGIFDSGTGVVHWWYADSSPWKVECWTRGLRDSVWYHWYQSGAIQSVVDHRRHSDSAGTRNYSPEGEFLNYGASDWYDNNLIRTWHGNGQMSTENGREAYREWYPDGTMSLEAEKIPVPEDQRPTNARHGKFTEWYADGSVKTTGQYKDGHASGLWTDWSPTGVKLAEQQPYYTRIAQTTFHDNGRPASRGECRGSLRYSSQNRKVGKWEYWDSTGDLVRVEEWVGGVLLYLDGVRTIP